MKFADRINSLKPSAIREIFKSMADPNIISLAGGNPDPESFPIKEMEKISAELFERFPSASLQYGLTEGYIPLREQVETRLQKKFGVNTDGNEVIITSGGQQGIDLTCRVLCNEGDTVICEDPSFIGALNSFRSFGTRLRGVKIDDDGMDMEDLERALQTEKNVKFIYTIPTFQNPTGVCMSLERRKKLLSLAEKYDVVILEDNPYGELRFRGEDIPTLKSLDKNNRVVYCSSFSKIFSPGIRIGFLCGPKEIIAKTVVAKQINDVHSNLFFQMMISKYIEEYDLDAHIESIKNIYRGKCLAMQDAVSRYFPKNIKCTSPDGGFFLWCNLGEGKDSSAFAKELMRNSVAVIPGATFAADETRISDGIRLNYSMPSLANIEKAIKIMGDVLNSDFYN